MKSQKIILYVLGSTALMFLSINFISLIFEMVQLPSLDNFSLNFKHGQFIFNQEKLGLGLYNYKFWIISILFALLVYFYKKRKI